MRSELSENIYLYGNVKSKPSEEYDIDGSRNLECLIGLFSKSSDK